MSQKTVSLFTALVPEKKRKVLSDMTFQKRSVRFGSLPPLLRGSAFLNGRQASKSIIRTFTGNWRAQASALLILIIVGGVFFSPFGTQGATFTFTQVSWSGGITANTAFHASNQTGWNQYGSKNANVAAVNAGADVELTPTDKTAVDDGVGLTALSPATVAAGVNPYAIILSPDGTSAYAANYNGSTVSQYSRNTSTGVLTALSPATINAGTRPQGIMISPDGTSVYVANGSSNDISQYSRNTSTGALAALGTPTIAAGTYPQGITISSDGASVYAVNYMSGNVSMYSRNTSTGALTALATPTIATGTFPWKMVISPNGTSVYVANQGDNTVSMYSRNTSTGALTALGTPTISTGPSPHGITISLDGASVYVTNYGGNNVTRYSRNTSTGVLTSGFPQIPAAGSPEGIAVSPDGTSVFVANYTGGGISQYSRNTSTGALTALGTPTITSYGAYAIAFSPDGSSVYVTNTNPQNTISMYSRTTGPGFENGTNSSTVVSGSGAGASVGLGHPANATVGGANITINTNTTWAAGTYNYGTITVTNNSTLTLNSSISGSGLTATGSGVIINADNIVVDSGSRISANGNGFAGGNGPGRGGGGDCNPSYSGPGGGGEGGTGGTGAGGFIGGVTYGSSTQPSSLGSGGGNCNAYAGGVGGGAIKFVVSGVFTNNGIVSADSGVSPIYSGGGSGGSIWIDTGTFTGSGTITTNGGTKGVSNPYASGGGGGRIAIYYNTKTYSGTITATGGTGYQAGGVGTIHDSPKPFYSSGTFTSDPINTGAKSAFTTLAYTATLNGQTITMDVRAGDTATPDGSWTGWTTGVASGGDISSFFGHQYIQYRANFATSDVSITPTLDSVTINYSQYGSGTLTSSPYNTSSAANLFSKLTWTGTNTSGTETIQFQVRSASTEGGLASATWCGYEDCSGTSYFDTAENGVALSLSHPLMTGTDDQYFQYKATLSSGGAITPTLSSIISQYVVNAAPDFDTSFGTNGITVSQISNSADINYGKVKIDYRIRDIDTTTGSITSNNITPSFAYNTGSGFTSIALGYLSATATDNKAVQEGSYTTYTAYWDAKSQIPETYTTSLEIKVTVNDNEAANNTATATDTTLSLDTKNPTIGATPIVVDASTTPATLTLSTTDDTSIQMKVSLNNDLGGASYETYNITKIIALASDPDTVYIQYRDLYGNETTIQSITTPETPTRMMVQDTSNLYAPPLSEEYRLFIAWSTILPSTPAFASYKIYRSSDNTTYTLLDTVSSRTTNYYGDNSVTFDTLYYYKVETVDANGNISYWSLPISGKANGIQDAGEGGGGTETTAPTISTVTSTAISTTEATITWETNELATSTVGFSGTPSTFTDEIGVEGYTDNASGTGIHKVVLSGLTPNTPYSYRILSTDPTGNQAIANNGGTGYTFTTNPGPAISGTALSNTSNTQATITWNTDISSDSTIRYATSVAGGSLVSPQETGTGTEVTSHSVLLTSLSPGTLYYFSVKSQHNGDIAIDTNGGAFYQFITTSDTQAPTISSLSAGVITYDRAALTWVTDEQATSQIKYATVSGGPYTDTTETVTYGSDHFVILPSLASDTTYYFKASSSDLSGNTILSPQNSFKTLQDPSYQHSPLTSITSMSATLITDTNAVISLVTDQPALCSIEHGTAPGNYTATPVTETLENKQHRITLPSLLFATTYYYQATCIDNLDTPVSSDEASFITLTEQVATGSEVGDVTAPNISGVGTSAVSGENATVTWTTDEVGNGLVRYGITNTYGNTDGDDLVNESVTTYATDHIVLLKNLIPSTKYYYKVSSVDAKGNIGVSSESSFTTTSPSTISSISILSTKIGEATLTWKTSTLMSSIIEYGLTETYGDKQESGTLTKDHTLTVSKLQSNKLYHFRVKGQDKDKNLYASSDYTYEPKSPPQLRNIESKVLSDNEAQVDFISSVPTDALITYTNTKDSKDTGSQGTPELQTTHSIIIKNLNPGSVYEGKIIAKDEAGNEVTETLKSFTTSLDDTGPVIDQLKTDIALAQDGKVQVIVSWYTNEPSTTFITYKEGTNGEEKNLDVKGDLSTSHVVVLTAFKIGSVYFLKAESTDKSGNETISKERMIITPQQSENVVQMIIGTFNDMFGWAKL